MDRARLLKGGSGEGQHLKLWTICEDQDIEDLVKLTKYLILNLAGVGAGPLKFQTLAQIL